MTGYRSAPPKPAKAEVVCGRHFEEGLAHFSDAEKAAVDDIVSSLERKAGPDRDTDVTLLDFPLGTAHCRPHRGVYIIYQITTQPRPVSHRVVLLECGRYREQAGGLVFDFDPDFG